jgi:adenylate kinase family enzyme
MSNILILGLAGSGKTTLARKIAEKNSYQLINVDNYRYVENWQKKDKNEFIKDVMAVIISNNSPKVIETSYNDASDPQNSRIELVEILLAECSNVYIIKSTDKIGHIENLINRSINRAIGKESQGSCVESSRNRAQLVVKCVENYDNNVKKIMDRFENIIDNKRYFYKMRDEFYDMLSLLFDNK